MSVYVSLIDMVDISATSNSGITRFVFGVSVAARFDAAPLLVNSGEVAVEEVDALTRNLNAVKSIKSAH